MRAAHQSINTRVFKGKRSIADRLDAIDDDPKIAGFFQLHKRRQIGKRTRLKLNPRDGDHARAIGHKAQEVFHRCPEIRTRFRQHEPCSTPAARLLPGIKVGSVFLIPHQDFVIRLEIHLKSQLAHSVGCTGKESHGSRVRIQEQSHIMPRFLDRFHVGIVTEHPLATIAFHPVMDNGFRLDIDRRKTGVIQVNQSGLAGKVSTKVLVHSRDPSDPCE